MAVAIAAVAPIQPLARELPYATGVALKKHKRKNEVAIVTATFACLLRTKRIVLRLFHFMGKEDGTWVS